jgi:hypothetical protein
MKGCASGGDRLADAGGLVRGAIVERHDATGRERRRQDCSTWAQNARPVIGPSRTSGATMPQRHYSAACSAARVRSGLASTRPGEVSLIRLEQRATMPA